MSVVTDVATIARVESYPGIAAPLLAARGHRESLEEYVASGGYAALGDVERLLEEVEIAGLRGRGGAAFPFATKVRTVRYRPGPAVVVANGEEGEPASVKDRWLMRFRPHLVLDGLRIAAALTGSRDIVVYASDPVSATSMQAAVHELAGRGTWSATIDIFRANPTYVAGEESALVRAVNGGPALPTEKPPRPFESGVRGLPTLVSNVETLAHLPGIRAASGSGYRSVGTEGSPGTFLLTLSGIPGGGLFEVPFGTTVRTVLRWLAIDSEGVTGLLVGGYFGGLAGAEALDVPLDYDAFRSAGHGLGCGAISILRDECPVAVAAAVMVYFARENAGQCGSCFNGTAGMSAVLGGLLEGVAQSSDLERLERWSTELRGRGACGTLDGAVQVVASLLRVFPNVVESHLEVGCAQHDEAGRPADPPFAVMPPTPGDMKATVRNLR